MKKSTIWLLTIIMALTFSALLYIQLIYLERMSGMRNEQFSESVMRSLYATSNFVERQETLHFLERDLVELEAFNLSDGSSNSYSLLPDSMEFAPKFGYPSPTQSIGGRYRDIHEMIRGRYLYQRGLLNEVILSILHEADQRPAVQRADSTAVREFLKMELANNGLNVPFVFAITNSEGGIVYQTQGFEKASEKNTYKQVLFPNSNTRYYLNVAFPTKGSYIFESVRFIIPSLALTLILLVVFLYTIITAFRQKRITEMKTDFINNMTHELKTPISTISLAGQMLNDSAITKSPASLQHISGVITDESKRLRFLVEKVLQMSVFDKNSTDALKFKEVDANTVITNVVKTFKIKAEKYGGSVTCRLEAPDADIYVDELQFTNVIFNLCDNAVKYMREDVAPEIEIMTEDKDSDLIIKVKDNGIGIKKDDIKRIFDKFYRVSTGNRHDVKGFGLGLAYVKRMVGLFQGKIHVESTPGEGSTFIISIPLLNSATN